MQNDDFTSTEKLAKLVDSLELITARMLDMTVSNNQLASSQTPEIRRLFGNWLDLMSDEILRLAGKEGSADIEAIASQIGVGRSSIVAMLLALHRRGRINISRIDFAEGSGNNEDICDCMN